MAEPVKGKPFSFNLTGDDLHLYETVRAIIEGEQEEAEGKISEALSGLDPDVRALVQARFAPRPKKDISQRQVFVTAMGAFLAVKEAEADEEAEEAEESDADATADAVAEAVQALTPEAGEE